jgi:hypothetical protein
VTVSLFWCVKSLNVKEFRESRRDLFVSQPISKITIVIPDILDHLFIVFSLIVLKFLDG